MTAIAFSRRITGYLQWPNFPDAVRNREITGKVLRLNPRALPGYFPVTDGIREIRPLEIPGYAPGKRYRRHRKHLFQNVLSATSQIECEFLREFSRRTGKSNRDRRRDRRS